MTDKEKQELMRWVRYCKRLGKDKQETVAEMIRVGFKRTTIKRYWEAIESEG